MGGRASRRADGIEEETRLIRRFALPLFDAVAKNLEYGFQPPPTPPPVSGEEKKRTRFRSVDAGYESVRVDAGYESARVDAGYESVRVDAGYESVRVDAGYESDLVNVRCGSDQVGRLFSFPPQDWGGFGWG